ncbi:MAG: hypothetical protein AAGA57_05755 [Planctomycetota bacterium]
MSGVVERRGAFRAAVLVYAAGLAVIVCAGAWLMASPWATPAGDAADAWERAFTAVSAACGSGLAWRDPATRWTPAGQWLLMGVGQAGWLWTVAFGAGLLGSILGRGAWRTGALAVVWCVAVQALLAAAAWGAWREAALAMAGLGWRLRPAEPGAAVVLGVILPAGLIGALGGGWWLWLARRGVTWRSYARVALGLTAGVFLVGLVAVGVAEALPGWFDRLGIGQTAGRVSAEGDVLAALGTAGTATMDAMGAGRGEVEPGSLRPGGRWALLPVMLLGGAVLGGGGGLPVLAWLAWGSRWGRWGRWGRPMRRIGVTMMLGLGAWVCAAVWAMLLVEPYGLGVLLFDVVSATALVGWSAGVPGELTAWGQGVLLASTVFGRLWPMVSIAVWGRMCETAAREP